MGTLPAPRKYEKRHLAFVGKINDTQRKQHTDSGVVERTTTQLEVLLQAFMNSFPQGADVSVVVNLELVRPSDQCAYRFEEED